MKLIEQYEEIIERSPSEISYAWKGAAVIAYFLSSLSGYTCSILFGVLWGEICGGHCYFWGDVHFHEEFIQESNSTDNFGFDWTEHVIVTYQDQNYCHWFHFTCLVSCVFAMFLLTMFLICGKGGYDTSLFFAPWRIVLPALIGSLLMMIMTMAAANSFTRGYFHFSESLYQMAYQIMERVNGPFEYQRPCEVFQKYTQDHNHAKHDSCGIYWMIQVSSSMMTWSWIASFFILLMRVLTSADFNLLKVKIYKMPQDGPEKDTVLKMIAHEGKNSLVVPHLETKKMLEGPKEKQERKEKVL